MIRYLKQEEKQNTIALYQTCFDDTEEYCSYYFSRRLPDNQVAVCENLTESSEIIAYQGMIHLIPKKVMLGNACIRCHYLYAVATDPSFRGQGVMGSILRKILEDMRQNGEWMTYLIPSCEENARIYQKFGFAHVMDKMALRPADGRAKMPLSVTIRNAVPSDMEALALFAKRMMEERYVIYISKNRRYFERMMELMEMEGGKVVLYCEGDVIKGYRIGFDDDVLEEVLDQSISDFSWEDASVKRPYAMARILNIPEVLKQIRTNERGHIYIEITDPVIEENNGIFLWEYSTEGNVWKRIFRNPCNTTVVKVSIGELSSHLMGYRKVEMLPKMNTKQGFYINDYV